MGSHRIQFGKGFGDLARESRVQALGLVNSDEFLEFACGIRLNARPFRFEHRTVHLSLGPHLAVAGSCRRRSAGQDDRRTGQQQGPGRRARADKALRDAGRRGNAVVDVENRCPSVIAEGFKFDPVDAAPPPSSQGQLNLPAPHPAEGARG